MSIWLRQFTVAEVEKFQHDTMGRTMQPDRILHGGASVAFALSVAMAVTGCGQTGSLYLPDDSVDTPVEIRKKDEEKKPAPPPGH
jgi:predicted small lipoprotein YifL